MGVYNEEYRHFDKLIWQVPAWGTGIFVGGLLAAARIKTDNLLTEATNTEPELLLPWFLGVLAGTLYVLSYVLYQFRIHQTETVVTLNRAFRKHHFFSAQLWLHTAITVQTLVIGALFLMSIGASHILAAALSVGLGVFTIGYRETMILDARRERERPAGQRQGLYR